MNGEKNEGKEGKHHEHEKHEGEKKHESRERHEGSREDNNRKQLLAAVVVAGLVCLVIGYFAGSLAKPAAEPATQNQSIDFGEAIDAATAGSKAKAFLDENFLGPQGASAEITSVREDKGIFIVEFDIVSDGQTVQTGESFVTKDGSSIIIGTMLDLSENLPQASPVPEVSPSPVPKTAKPEAEAFVMSYCPYGLQFEKALIPVARLLGEEADIQVKFVSYILHGEEESIENTRHYCVEKEYGKEAFWDYLECFTDQGNHSTCFEDQNISEANVSDCINATHTQYGVDPEQTPYPVHESENEEYGVTGSPTFVLNGVTLTVNRSPEAIKQAICDAFEEAPEECLEELSSTPASPGFGSDAGSGSGGTC